MAQNPLAVDEGRWTGGSTQTCSASPRNEAAQQGSCFEQEGRWPIVCRELQGSWKDARMHLRAITHEPINWFKRSKTIIWREFPPAFLSEAIYYSYEICSSFWPPAACYSHCCKSSISCCGKAKLQGRGCSRISLAIAAVLLAVWGFPVKPELSSTVSERLFSALKGFTTM